MALEFENSQNPEEAEDEGQLPLTKGEFKEGVNALAGLQMQIAGKIGDLVDALQVYSDNSLRRNNEVTEALQKAKEESGRTGHE